MGGEPRAAYLGGQGSPNTDHHLLLVVVHCHIERGFVHLGGVWLVSPSAMGWGQTQASDLRSPPSQPGSPEGCLPPTATITVGPFWPSSQPTLPSQLLHSDQPRVLCPACCVQSTPLQGLTAFFLDSFPQGLGPGSSDVGCGVRVHFLAPGGVWEKGPSPVCLAGEGWRPQSAEHKSRALRSRLASPAQPLTASWQEV